MATSSLIILGLTLGAFLLLGISLYFSIKKMEKNTKHKKKKKSYYRPPQTKMPK